MYEQLILRAAFIDRAGRTVYQASPLTVTQDDDGNEVVQAGQPIAMVRLRMDPSRDHDDIEWLAQPEPAPAGGFTPGDNGVEGGGTG